MTWTVPAGSPSAEPLVKLANVAGLTLRAFHFQGKERVHDLVSLRGRCPGFALEEAELRGFLASGVRLIDCTGDSRNAVSLRGLRTVAGRGTEAALVLQASPGQEVRDISVRDCRFEGPARASVQLAGAVSRLELLNTLATR